MVFLKPSMAYFIMHSRLIIATDIYTMIGLTISE